MWFWPRNENEILLSPPETSAPGQGIEVGAERAPVAHHGNRLLREPGQDVVEHGHHPRSKRRNLLLAGDLDALQRLRPAARQVRVLRHHLLPRQPRDVTDVVLLESFVGHHRHAQRAPDDLRRAQRPLLRAGVQADGRVLAQSFRQAAGLLLPHPVQGRIGEALNAMFGVPGGTPVTNEKKTSQCSTPKMIRTRINTDSTDFGLSYCAGHCLSQCMDPLRALSKTLRLISGLGPKFSNKPTSYGVAFK